MANKKPGKYDAVVGDLEPLPPADPSHQAQVNIYKDAVRKAGISTPEALAETYKQLRQGVGNPIDADFLETLIELLGDDGICALKAECDLRMEGIEQMLAESYKAGEPGWGNYGASDKTVRLLEGGSVSVQMEPHGKVTDKEAFRKWCIADGLENELQLWPSTMNAIVKKRVLEGLPEPDGVEAFSITKVILRKG